jgi:para-nitrobenzyl esterase
VLVFIHGGSNTTGSGNEYDPSEMVSNTDIIVVTINYRLGVFGFLPACSGCRD